MSIDWKLLKLCFGITGIFYIVAMVGLVIEALIFRGNVVEVLLQSQINAIPLILMAIPLYVIGLMMPDSPISGEVDKE